jgi:hypothetical protein
MVERVELRKHEFNRVMYVLTTLDSRAALQRKRGVNLTDARKTPSRVV